MPLILPVISGVRQVSARRNTENAISYEFEKDGPTPMLKGWAKGMDESIENMLPFYKFFSGDLHA
jgi:hypothetical protein